MKHPGTLVRPRAIRSPSAAPSTDRAWLAVARVVGLLLCVQCKPLRSGDPDAASSASSTVPLVARPAGKAVLGRPIVTEGPLYPALDGYCENVKVHQVGAAVVVSWGDQTTLPQFLRAEGPELVAAPTLSVGLPRGEHVELMRGTYPSPLALGMSHSNWQRIGNAWERSQDNPWLAAPLLPWLPGRFLTKQGATLTVVGTPAEPTLPDALAAFPDAFDALPSGDIYVASAECMEPKGEPPHAHCVQLRHWTPGKAVETWTSPNWRDVQVLRVDGEPSDTGVGVLARSPDQILVSLFTQRQVPGGLMEMARVATFNGKTWTITQDYIQSPLLMDAGAEGVIVLQHRPASYALIGANGAIRPLPMTPLSQGEQDTLEIVAAADHSGVVWAHSREHLYRRERGRWADVPIPRVEGHVLVLIRIGPVSKAETWVTVSYVRDKDTPNASKHPNFSTLSDRVNALVALAPDLTVVYRTRRPSETLHCVVGNDEVLEPVSPVPDASCPHVALLVDDATDDEGGRRLGALFAGPPAPEGHLVWVRNLGRTRLAIRPSNTYEGKKWHARAHDLAHWLEPACIDDKADAPLRESLVEGK